MHLAGQDRATATAAVTVLVNHMIQLGMRTQWYRDDPDARTAPVEESVRWTVFESDVPRRWTESWGAKRSAVPRVSFEGGRSRRSGIGLHGPPQL